MVLLPIVLEIACKFILAYDCSRFIIIIVKGITCSCVSFFELYSYCEILIHRYVCMLVCRFWTVSNYTSW
jgi:hypothetical protein